jgi:hypothetical protein
MPLYKAWSKETVEGGVPDFFWAGRMNAGKRKRMRKYARIVSDGLGIPNYKKERLSKL